MVSVRIPLTQDKYAHVSIQDAERVMAYKWSSSKARHTWYARKAIRIDNKRSTVLLHRFISGSETDSVVDHIDRNGLNCVRSNLRAATRSQNNMNRRADSRNKSGHRGVLFHEKTKKWRAHIQAFGKSEHLGVFDRLEDAVAARLSAEDRLFGEFKPK